MTTCTDQPVIVGLGTGRCGTRSLARLLDLQPGLLATHEASQTLSWSEDPDPGRHLRKSYTGAEIIADVGFYYLPYVHELRRSFRNIRFVCLKRDRAETIRSFCAQLPRAERWFHDERRGWARCFPHIRAATFAEQVRKYWNLYYDYAEMFEGDDFRIFPTEHLSSYQGAREILEFCGLEEFDPVPVHVGSGQP